MYRDNITTTVTLLDAVTATTTSAAVEVAGATNISLQGVRADHSSGSTAWSVTVSNDGTNYVAYNLLIDNVTNTNGQQLTRVASKSLGANGSVILGFDENFAYRYLKVTATETTDGTHSAILTYF